MTIKQMISCMIYSLQLIKYELNKSKEKETGSSRVIKTRNKTATKKNVNKKN